MPSEATNQATRREWRELGFFYDRDSDAQEWRIFGSVAGLRKFAQLVREYALNPRSDALSEHDHYGPYSYLEIGTWSDSEITDHWIAGPVRELLSLSSLIDDLLPHATAGDRFSLRKDYAPSSPYDLVLLVHDDAFDPARADTQCW